MGFGGHEVGYRAQRRHGVQGSGAWKVGYMGFRTSGGMVCRVQGEAELDHQRTVSV